MRFSCCSILDDRVEACMFFAKLMFVLLAACFFLVPKPSSADVQDDVVSPMYAVVSIGKDGESYTVRSIEVVTERFSALRTLESVHSSFNGSSVSSAKLTQAYFSIDTLPLVLCSDRVSLSGVRSGGCESVNSGIFSVQIPLFPDTAEAVLYNKGGDAFLTVDLRRFSRCNENSICDGAETQESCPADCHGSSGASLIGDTPVGEGVDVGNSQDGSNGVSTESLLSFWEVLAILVGMIALVFLGAWYVLRRREALKR